MADFGEYPPNMAPQDALVVREQAGPDHAVVQYSADDLSRPKAGPANPFKSEGEAAAVVKRKNVPTGTAEETYISEHTFRSKHRAVERRGGPERAYQTVAQRKQADAQVRASRESKGSALVAEGPGSYVGPWARYKSAEHEAVGGGGEQQQQLASDEEYEVVEEEEGEGEDGGEAVVQSGTVVQAPAASLARREAAEAQGQESTTFHGSQEFDYQGRTYMHVPQDLGIDLRKEVGSTANYIPKRQVHVWRDHAGAVTALRFIPQSGHLLLSGGADATVRIRDVQREEGGRRRELLRTYAGHTKAVSGLSFSRDGARFLSASYDRMVKLWDTERGVCLARFTTGKTPHVVEFSPDPAHAHEFLAGMSDKKILQYDTRAPPGGDVVQEYDHHLAAVNTVVFVDGGRRFMTTSDDRSLRAWDYGIPVPIKYIAEPDMYPMTRAAAHPGGRYVAYQSSDNQVLVFGAADKFRQNRKKCFRGHHNAGMAIDLDCSPDGQFLASGDSAGYVCFWDWKTCKMFHKIKADNQAVTCVKWHPQETSKVVTAGLEGEIKYWD